MTLIAQDKRNLLARMLFTQKAEGNLLQVDAASQILRKQRGCETISPVEGELSKMYDAEDHVFSDFVLCMGKGAMNEPEIKFANRWNDYLEQYRDSARIIMERRFTSYSTYFLAKRRTRSCVRSMNGFEKAQGQDGQNFTPETCPHRVLFMGMMNEIPISSKGAKAGEALFLQDSERNAAYFGKFKPAYLMYIGPCSEKELLKSIQMTQKENGTNEQSKLRKSVLYRSIQSCKDVSISREEN